MNSKTNKVAERTCINTDEISLKELKKKALNENTDKAPNFG